MSDAKAPRPNTPRVTVAVECQGPIGGDCGRTLRATVPGFDGSGGGYRGIKCEDCGRVTHAQRSDVLGGGEA